MAVPIKGATFLMLFVILLNKPIESYNPIRNVYLLHQVDTVILLTVSDFCRQNLVIRLAPIHQIESVAAGAGEVRHNQMLFIICLMVPALDEFLITAPALRF